jgi:hypothetical protein
MSGRLNWDRAKKRDIERSSSKPEPIQGRSDIRRAPVRRLSAAELAAKQADLDSRSR